MGDALGLPYEYLTPQKIPRDVPWRGFGTHNQPPGTYSDDTAVMLCHVTSFVERGTLDFKDVARRLVAWLYDGELACDGTAFDVGATTQRAIRALADGAAPLTAGPCEDFNTANGMLMRALPVALFSANLPVAEQVAMAHDASRLTHGHPRCQVTVAMYAVYARCLLVGRGPKVAWEEAFTVVQAVYEDGPWAGGDFLEELLALDRHHLVPGNDYCFDSLLGAREALIHGGSYEETVKTVVRHGHDTDTNAAIAGALAGLVYGVNAIPAHWRLPLRLAPQLRGTVDQFARLVERRLG